MVWDFGLASKISHTVYGMWIRGPVIKSTERERYSEREETRTDGVCFFMSQQ